MAQSLREWPLAIWTIPKGGTSTLALVLTDEAGTPLPWVTDGWAGEAQLRASYGGDLIATIASTGGDGTITGDDEGNVQLTLPSSFTEGLSATVNSRGDNSTSIVGDLEIWQTADTSKRYRACDITARIAPEATT